MPRLLARPRVDRRMDELMAGDQNGMNPVERGHVSPHVLPEELHGAETCVVAVRARIVPVHHASSGERRLVVRCARRGGGGLPMVGCTRDGGGLPVVRYARGGRLRVTRSYTQQGGVWRHGQRYHDRKYKCSEHVCSVQKQTARRTPAIRGESISKTSVFPQFQLAAGLGLGESPTWCLKSRSTSSLLTGRSIALCDRTSKRRNGVVPDSTPDLVPASPPPVRLPKRLGAV
jgi:hypothetical protein